MNVTKAHILINVVAVLSSALLGMPLRSQGISDPEHFAPYAFPVPELLEGRICDKLHIELSGDAVSGNGYTIDSYESVNGIYSGPGQSHKTDIGDELYKDRTKALTFKLNIPLWTDRATLSVWGEAHEWYSDTREVRIHREVDEIYPLEGDCSGNVYFSLDMLLFKEGRYLPSIALRAATQSATGDKYEVARHYDAPGYFFDISAGKSFWTGDDSRLRLSATAGFVCWQIAMGTQNDALMLGAKASWSSGPLSVSAEYGAYSGTQRKHGSFSIGDRPRTVQARAEGHFGKLSPFLNFQYGLDDWPFALCRAGISIDIDTLNLHK